MIITIDTEKESEQGLKHAIAILEEVLSRKSGVAGNHDVLGHLPHAEERVHRTVDPDVPPASLHPDGFGDIPPIVMGKRKREGAQAEPARSPSTAQQNDEPKRGLGSGVEILY